MIQALLMGGGMAMQAYSAFQSSKAQKQAAAINMQNAQYEAAIEQERHKQMLLNSRRQQLENIRNGQLARSMAITSSTSQGAQFGSGLAGGLGQVTAQQGWNALGINQNTEIGENIFSLNDKISKNKVALAGLGSDMATSQAISSFGGNIMKAAGSFGGNPFMMGGGGQMAVGLNQFGAPNQLGQYNYG